MGSWKGGQGARLGWLGLGRSGRETPPPPGPWGHPDCGPVTRGAGRGWAQRGGGRWARGSQVPQAGRGAGGGVGAPGYSPGTPTTLGPGGKEQPAAKGDAVPTWPRCGGGWRTARPGDARAAALSAPCHLPRSLSVVRVVGEPRLWAWMMTQPCFPECGGCVRVSVRVSERQIDRQPNCREKSWHRRPTARKMDRRLFREGPREPGLGLWGAGEASCPRRG